ncbi:MAG TPA: hypothetical protein VLB44_08095, partial [Kofleriaceae bacterium]|nr:hypothetical protein [Kofleriaceae bacterium]
APSSPPAPNPMPPSGGGPTEGTSMSVEPSTVPSARGTFLEPLDPYQARSDGGTAPPPAPRDGGIGGGGRDAGGGGTVIRRDGGLR